MEISMEDAKQIDKGPSNKGGLKTMPFIIANEVFEKVAGYGLYANMILYLIKEYHFSGTAGASTLYLWSALSNFTPILGAFLSDSCFGRFRVIALASLINLLGLVLLWLTAFLRYARPPPCNPSTKTCPSATPEQLLILFSAFALMSIGAGGIRPCSLAFGADQFDNPEHPQNERRLQTFFNWYYVSVGLSITISVTVIVYIQNAAGWTVGFGIAVILMLLSAILFLMGSSLYVECPPNRSLFSGFAQVIVATWKKRHLTPQPSERSGCVYYYHMGSKVNRPTGKLRFLNTACTIRNVEKELDSDGLALDPWYLCSVKQVEELKALIKVLPIWSTGIVVAVMISQHSFPVLQASTMDRRISSKVSIPAGSFGVFGIVTLTIWVLIYDRLIVPLTVKLTGRPGGLTLKQRMGIGLSISCVAMAVSALVEQKRRGRAVQEGFSNDPKGVIRMSAMWLVPQHCLIGLAEAFYAIGQIQFFYSEFPKCMASVAVALFTLGVAVGNLVGSLLVGIMGNLSSRGRRESWLSSNVNKGHYDYYYWVLTGMSVANLLYYVVCSWAYGKHEDRKVWDEEDIGKEKDKEGGGTHAAIGSPVVHHA